MLVTRSKQSYLIEENICVNVSVTGLANSGKWKEDKIQYKKNYG